MFDSSTQGPPVAAFACMDEIIGIASTAGHTFHRHTSAVTSSLALKLLPEALYTLDGHRCGGQQNKITAASDLREMQKVPQVQIHVHNAQRWDYCDSRYEWPG